MTFTVCFIERREGGSPSIERVFQAVAAELREKGIRTQFAKVPFGNGFLSTLLNLLCFRPPKADVFHVTGHVHYIALRLPPSRTVLTVHDLTILGLRSGLRRWLIKKLYFSWPSRRLKYLTAISEATKFRLVEGMGVESGRISVIDNPLLVSEVHQDTDFNAVEPTILQLGTAPNKNIERLIDAVFGLRCRLHIVGPLRAEVATQINKLGISAVNDYSLDDQGIEEALRNADIVTLCSTEEGFGLPIIEGQAKGTIVITSDRSPMREVSGGGAILVDPENIESMRNGILRVMSDPDLRSSLVEAGRKNVRRFRVERIADEYLGLYSRIIDESRSM